MESSLYIYIYMFAFTSLVARRKMLRKVAVVGGWPKDVLPRVLMGKEVWSFGELVER